MKFAYLKILSSALLVSTQIPAQSWTPPVATELPPQVKKAGLVANPNPLNPPSNDPYFGSQWALSNNGQLYTPKIHELLFGKTIFSDPKIQIGWKNYDSQMKRDVIVAVMDSGMYTSQGGHVELRHALLEGKNFINPTSKIYDDLRGHGTHIAGIMAANINNGEGISGLSNKIKILPLKVYGERENKKSTNENSTETNTSESNEITPRLVGAIDYAIEQKVDIIQLSLGWPRKEERESVRAAFERAAKAGIIIVAAAGNDGHNAQIYPCAYKEVLCVGAISLDGSTSIFSNRGDHVDLMAPGQAILSTIPPTETVPSLNFGIRGYDEKNGTSQAAPFVSGAAAILRGIYPEESAEQIKNRLRLGAVKLTSDSTFGLLNIENSINLKNLEISFAHTKSVEETEVDLKTLEFEFPLTIFSNQSSPLVVNVKSMTPEIAIHSVTKLSSIQNETKYLIRGKAASLQAANTFRYEIQVNQRLQSSDILLKARLTDLQPQTLPIENIEPLMKSGFIPVTAAQDGSPLAFWSFLPDKEKNTLHLHIWQKLEDRLIEKSVAIENSEAPLASFNLIQDDFDFNGSPDYLFASIFKPGSNDQALEFLYLDQNLKIMHRFKVDNTSPIPIFVSVKDIALAKIQYAGSTTGFLKVPVFLASGKAPEIDSMQRFKQQDEAELAANRPVASEDYIAAQGLPETERNSVFDRFYYYEPLQLEDGSLRMRQRSLTGHIADLTLRRLIYEKEVKSIFRQDRFKNIFTTEEVQKHLDSNSIFKLISEKGLFNSLNSAEKEILFATNKIHDDLIVLGLSPQNDKDISTGKFSLIFNLSRADGLQKYYRLEFSDLTKRYETASLRQLNIPDSVDLKKNFIKAGIAIKPNADIDTETVMSAIYTFHSARNTLLSRKSIAVDKFEIPPEAEAFVSVLKTFTQGSNRVHFVETTKNIYITGVWQGEPVTEKAQVYSTSFLPGYAFSQMFQPVIVSDRRSPGVVIDSSDIFTKTLTVYTLDDDLKMRSSIERTIAIPNNCRARQVSFINEKGFSSIPVICVEKDSTDEANIKFKVKLQLVELK